MKKGETKELDLTFPNDYYEESVAGKPVVFKVTLQRFTRPSELNDDLGSLQYRLQDSRRVLEEIRTKRRTRRK